VKISSGKNYGMESCSPPRAKPGPKPKGDRTATIVYLPTVEVYEQRLRILDDRIATLTHLRSNVAA
jgi:hypothetical protein